MRGPLLRWVAALALLLPGLAQAQWSIRLALEVPLHSHLFLTDGPTASTSIADTFQPGVDLLGGYAVADSLSLDLEVRTGLFGTGGYGRTPTNIGPGLTYDVSTFPLYGRMALPIQVEHGTVFFVRLGGGLKITDWGFFRLYFELTVDVALGATNDVKPGTHSVNVALGMWFKL